MIYTNENGICALLAVMSYSNFTGSCGGFWRVMVED